MADCPIRPSNLVPSQKVLHLMILALLSLCESASFARTFPFTPIFLPHPTRSELMIRDFFDFAHLDPRDPSTERIKTAVANLRSGDLIRESLSRLRNLTQAGNPHAAYVLGSIHEFGLFFQTRNDTLARRYYSIGSKSGSPECQANLAFFLRYGIGGPIDIRQASSLTDQSRRASIWSLLHTVLAKQRGISIRKSCKDAFRDLEPLSRAILANSSGLRKFGNLGVKRISVLPTPNAAKPAAEMEFAKILAGAGNAQSNIALGRLYLRERPPDYAKAKEHLRRAGEDGVADGWLLLYFIESREANAAERGVALLEYLKKAAALGSPHAKTELAKLHLESADPEARAAGASLLAQSVEAGGIEGAYLLGLEMVRGRSPFAKNVTDAFRLFEICRNHSHHAVLYSLAVLHFQGVAPTRWFCNEALNTLFSFVEKSFVFDDADLAWDAVAAGDLEYALRIYERLADMGSEAAAWNAERISRELGINGSAWTDLLVQMESIEALRKAVEPNDAQELAEAAARVDPKVAFQLGWEKRGKAWRRSEKLFWDAVNLKREAALPVWCARAWSFIEKLPAFWRNRWEQMGETDDSVFVGHVLRDGSPAIAGAVFLAGLYLLIGLRVRLFHRPSDDE
jgi:TPR repeat protein